MRLLAKTKSTKKNHFIFSSILIEFVHVFLAWDDPQWQFTGLEQIYGFAAFLVIKVPICVQGATSKHDSNMTKN